MDIQLSVSELVAVYAAFVATISIALHVRNWWLDRPHVKVTASYALTTGLFGNEELVEVSAINKGRQPVDLEQAGFLIENRQRLVVLEAPRGLPQPRWPYRLVPGSKHSVYFSIADVREALGERNYGLAPRAAWFRDVTGKVYRTTRHLGFLAPSR